MSEIAFISGQYRADTTHNILENIRKAEQVAIKYWQKGYVVICPHLNTRLFDGVLDDDVWLKGYLEILKRCDVIIMMKQWQKSIGASLELQQAKKYNLKIIYD